MVTGFFQRQKPDFEGARGKVPYALFNRNKFQQGDYTPRKDDFMRIEKSIEISVKPVFIGIKTAEQVFVDLIRRQISANGLEPFTKMRYNNSNVVFPCVHAPERGVMQ